MDDGEIAVWTSVAVVGYSIASHGVHRIGRSLQDGATGQFSIVDVAITGVDQFLMAAILVGFGYSCGTRLNMVQHYRRFAGEVAVGAAGGLVFAGLAGHFLLDGTGSQSAGSGAFAVVGTIHLVVVATAYAFAGAAAVQLAELADAASPSSKTR